MGFEVGFSTTRGLARKIIQIEAAPKGVDPAIADNPRARRADREGLFWAKQGSNL
jgi:hypothetical protein